MIRIIKNICPHQLIQYSKKEPLEIKEPFADKRIKDIVRISLLTEQKYLCAYCMASINENNSVIEHILPKSSNESKARAYSNLLVTCNNKYNHCDKSKKNNYLKKVHLLIFNSIDDYISYKNDGTIEVEDKEEDLKDDINNEELLNLNQPLYLKRNRKKIIEQIEIEVHQMIKKKYSKVKIKNKLNRLIQTESDRKKLTPYSGVLIYKIRYYKDL